MPNLSSFAFILDRLSKEGLARDYNGYKIIPGILSMLLPPLEEYLVSDHLFLPMIVKVKDKKM